MSKKDTAYKLKETSLLKEMKNGDDYSFYLI